MNSIEQRDESGTWVLAATGFTTPIEDNSPKVIRTCACPELGYWCAEYITEEMKKNLSTPQGKKLKALVSEAFNPIAMIQSLSWWQKPLILTLPGVAPTLIDISNNIDKISTFETSGEFKSVEIYLNDDGKILSDKTIINR